MQSSCDKFLVFFLIKRGIVPLKTSKRLNKSFPEFLHLNAELNYYRLFNDAIAGADLADVTRRQREAFTAAGVPLPEGMSS